MTKTALRVMTAVFLVVAIYFTYTCFKEANVEPPVIEKETQEQKSPAAIPFKAEMLNNGKKINAWTGVFEAQMEMTSVQQKNEREIFKEDYIKLGSADSKFLFAEAAGQLPFQRFDIVLKEETSNQEKVILKWQGRANHPLLMFAWNFNDGHWDKLDYRMERNIDNIVIKADVEVARYFRNNTAHILLRADKRKTAQPKAVVPEGDNFDFAFAWLTDTQYYSDKYPKIFDTMTLYIAENKTDRKIQYSIHTGDITNNGHVEDEWKAADKSMQILDKARIPYGVLAGNHDVSFDKNDYANFYKYFGDNRFKDKAHFGGSLKNNKNHYDLITIGHNEFIILYFGWKPESEDLEWANRILGENPEKKAILALHSYIYKDGTYHDGGLQIRNQVVNPNKNVFMVLCGHFHGSEVYTRIIGNRKVYELLFDTQSASEGGAGYLRLLHFDVLKGFVYVNTYSPHLEDYNYFEASKDQFVLPFDPNQEKIFIGTDLIGDSQQISTNINDW